VWLPFRLLGAGAFRAALDEKLDLAQRAATALHAMDGIEVVADPQLSVVAFRVAAPGMDQAARNEASRALLDAVNRRRRVYLTATTVGGSFLVRICVLSFRTHADRIDAGLEDIRAGLAEVLGTSA